MMDRAGGTARPLAPHLLSGLETEGMKRVRCTLKVQSLSSLGAEITALAPKRLVVPRDGQPHSNIKFHGCKIIQMGFTSKEVSPILMIIGGQCTYTKSDRKNFEIMMRTKEQSLVMHLPPNGEFDWPDYKAFETCPICCRRAKPGTDDKFWLLFQMLLQNFENETQRGLGIRYICRLTCKECFESLAEDEYVQAREQGSGHLQKVPLLDVVEQQGPITWLRDGQKSAWSQNRTCLNAYSLYGAWENSGAWQAMSDHFTNRFHEVCKSSASFGGSILKMPGLREREYPSTFWEMDQIPKKEGRVCDGPDCSNVHGSRKAPEPGQKKGKKVRLQECTGCFHAMYCSEKCQRAAWADHKDTCREIQRKRKEEDEKKKEELRLDDEAKMEAALASFVPLSIAPQGGGAKKRKGKKGGKKKGGKKK